MVHTHQARAPEPPAEDTHFADINKMLASMKFAPADPSLVEAAKAEAKTKKVLALQERWGAPPRHANKRADRTGPWGQKLAMIESQIGQGALFGIYGGRGGGKTQLAVEAMKAATRQLMTARYVTAMDLFLRLKATFRHDSVESEQDVIQDLRRPRVLVIDEIGKRGQSDWENNLLFALIDARYGHMKDTLVMANLDEDEFVGIIGASLASRMNETGGLIHANWPSRR